jgi:NADH-ubiquinone oxidoreductase chain 4
VTLIFFFNLIRWEIILTGIFLRSICLLPTPVLQTVIFYNLGSFHISNIRFLLSFLSLLTFFWAIGYSRLFLQIKNNRFLIFSCVILILRLQMFFVTYKIFFLYITFELSVIPIFIIIIGWGYQRERLGASLRLIFYTLTASMPLLVVILWLRSRSSWDSFFILRINSSSRGSSIRAVLRIFALIAFAVKLPIFGVHIWLPKAHVEAPVIGSIILAAILLKLGSFGLWVIMPLTYSYLITGGWVSTSLIGAVLIRILCVRLRDVKIIIAYSSVSHIALVLSALILNNFLSSVGALILILAHGARSSAIFLISYFLYQRNHSRRLLLTKGILVWSRSIPVFWFLILISNIAAPPTFNLISEILRIRRIVLIRSTNRILLVPIILLRTTYSLVIYRSTTQGRTLVPRNMRHPGVSSLLRIFNHLVWVGLIIFALNVVNI